MKTILLFLVAFLPVLSTGWAQTRVTFERGTFLLNGSPFFPIGWYGLHTAEDLDAVRSTGATAVINYWNDICYFYPPTEYTARGYAASLKRYLAVAGARGFKVIVQLPMEEFAKPQRLVPDSFLQTILGDSSIRNHTAVLGWYQADEPDQTPRVTRDFLIRRYSLIKRLDPAKPVFVVFGVSATFNERFPARSGKFYDVLMADSYPFNEGDPVPAKDVSGWQAQQLKDRFQAENTGSSGTTMFVAQGNGLDEYKPRKRNPTPLEIRFQALSYIHWAQHQNASNAGGLLFWWYKPSDRQCRKDVGEFIKYFTGNRLDVALRQERVVTEETYPVVSFMRTVNDTAYLFTVNESDSIVQDARLTIPIEGYAECTELRVPLGNNTRRNLAPFGPGKFLLTETFGRRECHVYRIVR